MPLLIYIEVMLLDLVLTNTASLSEVIVLFDGVDVGASSGWYTLSS